MKPWKEIDLEKLISDLGRIYAELNLPPKVVNFWKEFLKEGSCAYSESASVLNFKENNIQFWIDISLN